MFLVKSEKRLRQKGPERCWKTGAAQGLDSMSNALSVNWDQDARVPFRLDLFYAETSSDQWGK